MAPNPIRTGLHNIHFTTQYRETLCQGRYSAQDFDRFWSKVRPSGPGQCWLWTASKMDRMGHGQFTVRRDGKQSHLYAHRVAWELTHGPIPAGQCVCHHCDVPECCNPDHLFLGTQADNLNDARAKGRLVDGLGARKLSDAAYRDILSTPQTRGSGVALARKYGVTKVTISRIRHGHQGSTYQRTVKPPALERVPFVRVPVRGVLHVGQSPTSESGSSTQMTWQER